MIERFTSEDVKTIEGEGILATVHHWNLVDNLQLAYHGGPHPANELRTSIPYWSQDSIYYPDSGIPVTCASSEPLIPTFHALAPRGHGKYLGTEEGGVRFLLNRDKLQEFYEAVAYVAILGCGNEFKIFKGASPKGWPGPHPIRLPELRSSKNQRPLFNVKVTAYDFLQLLSVDHKAGLGFFE